MLQGLGPQGDQTQAIDQPLNDTAECIQISSLALLKMLKHGTSLDNKYQEEQEYQWK